VSEVREDIPLMDGDACCCEEATPRSVFGLRDERTNDRELMRVEWVEMGWLMGSSARKVIAGLPM
jgi:hypothetical protein